ncbi:hypothetical protein [Sutterella wadsworthensis]|uniref:hypothetical protein n=1 Tax=Sutterella wadsworthensis TaxID=40545 RepID=UPI0035211128
MNYKTAALFVVLVTSLAGCSTTLAPQRSASGTSTETVRPIHQQEDEAEPQSYRERIEVVVQRMRAACVAQDNQPYYRKTACLPSGITDEMTKDSTRITAAQKRAAEAVFAFTHELNEETRRIMRETQDPALAARAELSQRLRDPQINTLQEDLLSGKITWGEYNTARHALAEAVRSDLENE